MDAKETVKQGLQARKDTRAAELRAEKLREDVAATNDARFREQLSYRKAKRSWLEEKDLLVGTVYRQQSLIRQLRLEKQEMDRREANAQHVRTLIGAVKAVGFMTALIVAQDMGWIVAWLAASLKASAATYLFFAIVTLVRGKK